MNPDENSSWEYKPDDPEASDSEEPTVGDSQIGPGPSETTTKSKQKTVSWTASEYVEHQRGPQWYVVLIAGVVVLTAAVYLLTKDYFATGMMPVIGVILAVFARQKPRQVTYELNRSGLKIAEKPYDYALFKSFSVIRVGALNSVNFYPLKRFMPPITIYFDAKDEKSIVDTIGDHLPYEERPMDGIDKLSHRLKL